MIQDQESFCCRSLGGMFSRAAWGFVNMPEDRLQAIASYRFMKRPAFRGFLRKIIEKSP